MTLPEINHLRSISHRRLVHVAPGATTPTLATLDPATGAKCLSVDMFRRFLAGRDHPGVFDRVVIETALAGPTS